MDSDDESDFSGMESGLLADVKKAPLPNWDIFRETPPSLDTGSAVKNQLYIRLEKLAKVLAYLIAFAIVLVSSIVSKGSIIFIIQQLEPAADLGYCWPQDTSEAGGASWANNTGNFQVDLTCSAYTSPLLQPELEACREERKVEKVGWIWAIAFAFAVPQLGSFLRCLRKCLFKFNEWPRKRSLVFVTTMEALHTAGLAILCYLVLPRLDSVKAILLTSGLALAPACLLLLARLKEPSLKEMEKDPQKKLSVSPMRMCLDGLAIAAQLSAAVVWPVLQLTGQEAEVPDVWALPTALVLTSCGYWENFTEENSWTRVGQWLYEIKAEMAMGRQRLKEDGTLAQDLDGNKRTIRSYVTRNMTYVIVAPVKIIIFFLMMALLPWHAQMISHPSDLLDHFQASFGNHSFTISSMVVEDIPGRDAFSPGFMRLTQIPISDEVPHVTWLLLIQIFSSYIAYTASKFASKVQIQLFSFALPLSLSLPCCLALLVSMCGARADDICAMNDAIPSRLFFQCPEVGDFFAYTWQSEVWLGLVWIASFLWITIHIWYPKSPRLASSEQLFGTPWYDGLFIDQSLMMNRRRDGKRTLDLEEIEEDEEEMSRDYLAFPEKDRASSKRSQVKDSDTITRIYACATMWHESEEEMLEMLKSIFRVDSDYSKRRLAQKYFKVVDPDYYEFESHILFDDSHKLQDTNEGQQFVVNDYVVLLCSLIDKAGSRHFGKPFKNRPCKKYPTPYGGRLVWTLPGKTKIICHLKDKKKIRHKKRWSQIMYMYYLLGYKIMELPISDERKEARAENTFLLALDGDVDFQPDAIIRLVDMMKKNKGVGAACGRIHPTGGGYMPAYQVFEYAVGHWLQKATEHVLGCVLCSPGCFSLFRGQAIMDDNVMRKYTTVPVRAWEHIQYDQGEDRWLCTLMLQQGWRVEYSAASDSFTACPVDFDEFFKQRKRWMPSTLLNILDVLGSWREITRKNEDISKIYIMYQMGIMVGTFIGPGAIYMVLAGSLPVVFGVDNLFSIAINAVPIFLFCLACYYADGKFQLAFAKLLTLGYTMLMLAVYVGVLVEIINRGMLSAAALSAYSFFGPLALAGLLHPEEAYCMLCMPIYLITIPSMYILLVIYSLFNLNDISWGTREAAKSKAEQLRDEDEARQIEQWQIEQKKKSGGGLLSTFSSGLKIGDGAAKASGPVETGSVDFSIGNVLRCMCFTKEDPQETHLIKIESELKTLGGKLDSMTKSGSGGGPGAAGRRRSSTGANKNYMRNLERMGSLKEDESETSERHTSIHEEDEEDEEEDEGLESKPIRDDLSSPYWIEDEKLGKGKVDFLKQTEILFWQNMIVKYLLPLSPSPVDQAKQKKELAEYRDSFIFTFVMVNILYIVAVIMLQFQADFKIDWLIFESFDVSGQDGLFYAFEYTSPETSANSAALIIQRTNVDKLDVIGLAFLVMFSSIVFAQMIGMLLHRWQTLCQYIASTQLGWIKEGEENSVDEVLKVAHAFVNQNQAPEADEGSRKKSVAVGVTERRKTISALTSIHRQTGGGGQEINLEKQFLVRFNDVASFDKPAGRMSIAGRRGTMAVLANRRASYINNERRRSSVGFTSIDTRQSSFDDYDNQGYDRDSMFGEEDSFSEGWADGRPMGRNSVQFDVTTSNL